MKPCERLGSVGVPSFSIPRAYLIASLDLLICGVKRIKRKKNFSLNTFENTITRNLVSEMYAEQEQSGYSIKIEFLSGILSDPTSPDELREIDIKFTWNVFHPNSYLAVQAKRLYGVGHTLAGPYVEDGVMDFIDGKYSRGHNYGIMLGYVLSKPIENAISAVIGALKERKKKTNETSSFIMDKIIDYQWIYKSGHAQKNNGMTINIYHMFVDLAS